MHSGSLLGLSEDKSKAAILKQCQLLLLRAGNICTIYSCKFMFYMKLISLLILFIQKDDDVAKQYLQWNSQTNKWR